MAQTKRERNKLKTQYSMEHYERIVIASPKGTKEQWKKYAERDGLTVTRYVMKCVEQYEATRE